MTDNASPLVRLGAKKKICSLQVDTFTGVVHVKYDFFLWHLKIGSLEVDLPSLGLLGLGLNPNPNYC